MKSVRKALFVLIGCLLLNTSFAQQRLRITVDSFSTIPSSVIMGDTFNFNVRIYNDSVFDYPAFVFFGYQIRPDTTKYNIPDSSSGIYYSGYTDTIPAHGFILRTLRVNVSSPAFKAGPSVVVIWPIAPSTATLTPAIAADTIFFELNVDTLLAGVNNPEDPGLRLFKGGNALRIEKGGEIQLRRVRIFDVLGQQILDSTNPADKIPLPWMNSGIYLVEVTYNNNRRKVFRFYN